MARLLTPVGPAVETFRGNVGVGQSDLAMASESVYALLVANGAGKSTTLHILLNLLRPITDHAEIFGHAFRHLSAEDLARIGYVADGQNLPDWMTVGTLMAYFKPLSRMG
jgi:ABC-2 type transport system ATP-binding protein